MIPDSIDARMLDQAMASLVRDLENHSFDEVFRQAHDLIRQGVAENFASHQNSLGGAWPPRRDKEPHPLLQLTQALYGAATQPNAAGAVERVDSRGSELGIDLDVIPYARAQNLGHDYGTHVLPPREYLYISDETLAVVDDLIAEYALTAIF
jgi:hypothetical protein